MHSRCGGRAGGSPLILVHGLVISSSYMAPLARCLAVSDEVHALDLPGFGASDTPARPLSVPELADAILRWMSAAAIERGHLIANSLGCQIVAHCAVKAPERVLTTTMIGPTIDAERHRLSAQFFRLLLDAIHEPLRLWLLWLRDFWRCGLPRALATTRLMFADHIENQLERVVAPTLILRGERDPTVPLRWANRAQKLLRRAELITLQDAQHCVHFTEPARVAALIRAHIASSRTG